MERHDRSYIYVLSDKRHRSLAADLTRGLNRLGHPTWVRERDSPGMDHSAAHLEAVRRASVVVVLETLALRRTPFAHELMWEAEYRKHACRRVIVSLDRDWASVDPRPWSGHIHKNAPASLRRLIAMVHECIRFEESFVSRDKRRPTGARGRYVFISYASASERFADLLRERLPRMRINFWDYGASPRHEMPYREELRSSIERARVVLIVLTAAWRDSPDCQDEVLWAEKAGRRCIWLRFGPNLPPVPYREPDLVDLRSHAREKGWEELERRLFPSRRHNA